jgi:hypothetical protein
MRILDFGGGRDRCRGFDMLFWRGESGADVGIWRRDDDWFDERFDRELDVLGLGWIPTLVFLEVNRFATSVAFRVRQIEKFENF